MTKRYYIKQALRHESGDRVPYRIQMTGDVYRLYGDQLLKDYYNPEVMDDYQNGSITKEDAVNLSIGNYMTAVPAASSPTTWKCFRKPSNALIMTVFS